MKDNPPARPTTKSDETPEFVEFWKVWQPVKSRYDARALARDGFFHHVWWRGADPQDIVDGAKYYVHNFEKDQLRLLSRNWMDRGFYEDDAEKWREFQARMEERQSQNVVSMQRPQPTGQTAFLREFNRKKQAAE